MPTAHINDIKVLRRQPGFDKFDKVFSGKQEAEEAQKFGDPIELAGLDGDSDRFNKTLDTFKRFSRAGERILVVTSAKNLKASPGMIYKQGPNGLQRATENRDPGLYLYAASKGVIQSPKEETNGDRTVQPDDRGSAGGGGAATPQGRRAPAELPAVASGSSKSGPGATGDVQPQRDNGGKGASGQQSEDVITGTLNPHLTEQGHKDADRLASRTKNIKDIHVGSMHRTHETGEHIAKASGGKIEHDEGMCPWNLGELQGKLQHEVDGQINDFISKHPEKPVPGGGQSYNVYKDPLIRSIQKEIKDWKPGQRILNVTHSIGVHTLLGWFANGAPEDRSINVKFMLNREHMKPIALYRINPRNMTMTEAQNSNADGIYVARHANTKLDDIKAGSNPAAPKDGKTISK